MKSWERSHAITAARGLTPAQKAALFIVADHCNRNDECFLGLRKIAAEVGVVINTARTLIDALVAAGWLEMPARQKRHDSRGTRYRFVIASGGVASTSSNAERAAAATSRLRGVAPVRTVSPTETVKNAATVSPTETVNHSALSQPTTPHCLSGGTFTVSTVETKRDWNGNSNGKKNAAPSQDFGGEREAEPSPGLLQFENSSNESALRVARDRLENVSDVPRHDGPIHVSPEIATRLAEARSRPMSASERAAYAATRRAPR